MGISSSAGADRVGTIKAQAAGYVDAGYLFCNGAAVSRANYAALFAVISTIWGAGDGATTFNIPDLQGRTMIGTGGGAGLTFRIFGESGGEETHVLSAAEMPVHAHTSAGDNSTGGAGAGISTTTPGAISVPTNNAGSGSAHNVMQPYKVVLFQIKY